MPKRDIDYSLRHTVIFRTKKQRKELERIAEGYERSLNYVINWAIDEFIKQQSVDETKKD